MHDETTGAGPLMQEHTSEALHAAWDDLWRVVSTLDADANHALLVFLDCISEVELRRKGDQMHHRMLRALLDRVHALEEYVAAQQ